MLKGKQKSFLRSLAHHTKPIMQIGKSGITDNFIETFEIQLDSHELIKVSVLPNCLEDKNDLIEQLVEKTNCDLVQTIGKQLVFYRESTKIEKENRIKLPV